VEPINLGDFERLAAELIEPAALAYFAGGANDELTLAENVAAFRRWHLRPRVMVDVADPSTTTTVLGQEIALPVLIAPVAYQRVAHPDGEVAMARAAASAGTIMCLSTLANASWDEVCPTGARLWFQFYVPRDEGLAEELVAGARERGFRAVVLTVDTPVLGRRERDLLTGFRIPNELGHEAFRGGKLTPASAFKSMSASVTWKDVERFTALTGLPVVLKGILTAEDARLACENGAAAIVVSNHGGRQLDGVSATIDALSEIVEAVDGRIDVLLDGGIRRGTDVLKALALGADAVLVGRPALWGLAVGGEQGAGRVLELLRAEVELALQLVGCRTPAELTRAHVARAA
jgi:isopentenyl diphosphate isomerase/L-lactate dehydrogenase-like FMN-dependent dehydrogenase